MMKLMLSFLAGALMVLAFAPYGIYPLSVLSLLFLLLLWEKAPPRQALSCGFFYGLGYFGFGASWIYISIHTYGNSGTLMASFITVLFVAYLSLFPTINGYFLNKYFPQSRAFKWLLIFPATWALLEWVRSFLISGFPWLLLGHSQTTSPLAGFAPIIGVYGVSFLTALIAGLFFTLIKFSKKYLSVLFIVVILFSGYLLKQIQWTKPLPQIVKVSLIQGDIPITLKWSSDIAVASLQEYIQLSKEHFAPKTLIVWPETAVTLFLGDALPLLEDFDRSANQNSIAVLTGIPIPDGRDGKETYFNSAIMLGSGTGSYFKRHLVPFGEYTPFEDYFGKILNFLSIPMSSFVEGPLKQPLMTALNLQIAPYICYEIAYPALLRTDLPEANLLVTISNDSWFDQSKALGQHRQIAQFAALLSGRYMVISTNSGETAIINPQGKILAKAPKNIRTVLNGEVYGMEGATPWVRIGDMPFILFFGVILIIGLCFFRR
jgi:apolipoprotein N-acyltransferase